MKTALVILLISLLSGCAFDPSMFKSDPEIKVVTVEKPLLYCPAPPDFEYPRLVIEDLVPGDEKDPGRVVQYWKATAKQLEGEVIKRDTILEAYRKIQNKNPDLKPIEVERMFNEMIKDEAKTTNK